jgi:hypothetical protein
MMSQTVWKCQRKKCVIAADEDVRPLAKGEIEGKQQRRLTTNIHRPTNFEKDLRCSIPWKTLKAL